MSAALTCPRVSCLARTSHVAVFGFATIAFAVSQDLLLSLAALAVSGAADMVSVFIRHGLVQLRTPDVMRGRVAAVNMIFIGASNELGEFESGVVAQWLGTEPAVVAGGIATCLVVLLWVWWFPALRAIDRLDATESSCSLRPNGQAGSRVVSAARIATSGATRDRTRTALSA